MSIAYFPTSFTAEQLARYAFIAAPFANEPRFSNSYFCLVFFGRKTISLSSSLFPLLFLPPHLFVDTNSLWGPTKTTTSCMLPSIFVLLLLLNFLFFLSLRFHLLSSEKYWEFVSIEELLPRQQQFHVSGINRGRYLFYCFWRRVKRFMMCFAKS